MKTIKTEAGTMSLLPPRKDVCQTCATDHKPEMPHNAQSLYYQTAFQMEHGRWPNWIDAMAHCTDEMRAQWTEHLKAAGVDVEGGQVNPATKPKVSKKKKVQDA